MCHVVVCLITAIRYENDRFCEFRPIHQFYKRLRFVLLSSILYDGVQIDLTFQIVQSVQMQQVVSAPVLRAIKVGCFVVNVAWNLHMGTVCRQQCVPVPPSDGTVLISEPAQNFFKGRWKEFSPLLNKR